MTVTRYFSPTSPINTRLPADVQFGASLPPLMVNGKAYPGAVDSWGVGIPVDVMPAGSPSLLVYPGPDSPQLWNDTERCSQTATKPFRIPGGPQPGLVRASPVDASGRGDRHSVMVAVGRAYNLYHSVYVPDLKWPADQFKGKRTARVMAHCSINGTGFAQGDVYAGTLACGASPLTGLIRLDEMDGPINHALQIVLHGSYQRPAFVAPAVRTDVLSAFTVATARGPCAMGDRLACIPEVMDYAWPDRRSEAIAQAMVDFGGFVMDTSASWPFIIRAESPAKITDDRLSYHDESAKMMLHIQAHMRLVVAAA